MAKAKAPRSTGKQNGGSVPVPDTPAVHTENTSEIREIRKAVPGPMPSCLSPLKPVTLACSGF